MKRLVARQHLLPSVAWLLEQAAACGEFSSIDFVSKDYSAIAAVEAHLPHSISLRPRDHSFFSSDTPETQWVLLDEGGAFHMTLPADLVPRCAGVEQTTFGMKRIWKYPSVLVCRSAAKLFFESQIIARAIRRKLESLQLLDGRPVGVIGLGALGSAVTRNLIAAGVPTLGFDAAVPPDDLLSIHAPLTEFLMQSDVILGCTGADCLAGVELFDIPGEKTFVSCSSADVEFRSVLRALPSAERFATATGVLGQMGCAVLNGGFPINFDREREWETFDEIVLTRKLVLAGLLQASSLIGTSPRGIMLDPAVQFEIVRDWLEHVGDRRTIRTPESFTEEFFRRHSEGEMQHG